MAEEHSFVPGIAEGSLRRETRLARKKLPTSCLQHCAQKDTLSREMTLLKDKKDKSEQKMQAKQRCASAYQSSYSAKCLTFIVTRISCPSNQVKQLPTPWFCVWAVRGHGIPGLRVSMHAYSFLPCASVKWEDSFAYHVL